MLIIAEQEDVTRYCEKLVFLLWFRYFLIDQREKKLAELKPSTWQNIGFNLKIHALQLHDCVI